MWRILDFFDVRTGGRPGGQLLQIAETLRQVGLFHIQIPEVSHLGSPASRRTRRSTR